MRVEAEVGLVLGGGMAPPSELSEFSRFTLSGRITFPGLDSSNRDFSTNDECMSARRVVMCLLRVRMRQDEEEHDDYQAHMAVLLILGMTSAATGQRQSTISGDAAASRIA
jgi:hypothetical protein